MDDHQFTPTFLNGKYCVICGCHEVDSWHGSNLAKSPSTDDQGLQRQSGNWPQGEEALRARDEKIFAAEYPDRVSLDTALKQIDGQRGGVCPKCGYNCPSTPPVESVSVWVAGETRNAEARLVRALETESPLTAEEKLLYEAMLLVIDDGDPHMAGRIWFFYGMNIWEEDTANEQRTDFAKEVIATWRKFKSQRLDAIEREETRNEDAG